MRERTIMKISYLLKSKKRLISISISLILVVTYGVLVLVNSGKPPITTRPDITLAPTKKQVQPTINKPKTNPPVKYNRSSSEKMLDRLKNRTPLSTKDASAKQRIISDINGKSSVLILAPTFRIQYISNPDIFMVEIRTIDIGKGKSDARDWLVSQGFTEQGACELPVVYYLNSGVASQLRDLGITFSPLAEGC